MARREKRAAASSRGGSHAPSPSPPPQQPPNKKQKAPSGQTCSSCGVHASQAPQGQNRRMEGGKRRGGG
eukprot:3671102-Pyramimonas_sp.AAC.1